MSEEMKNRVRLNSNVTIMFTFMVFSYKYTCPVINAGNVDTFDLPVLLYACRKRNCSEKLT